MQFWRLQDPFDDKYAVAGRLGTWDPHPPFGGTCPECGTNLDRRVSPLLLEWELGSNVIGDFLWPGFGYDIAVSEAVGIALSERFKGFRLGPVEMVGRPLHRSRKKADALGIKECRFFEFIVETVVSLDFERSTASVERSCKTCGRLFMQVDGFETRERDPRSDQWVQKPRTPGKGLFVHREALGGADFFAISQFPASPTFCTTRVKEFLENSGATNVGFAEYGDVI